MRDLLVVAVGVLLAVAVVANPLHAKEKAPTTRTIVGRVADGADNPLADAVVYLTNTKTADIRTYITDKEGAFHFSALAQNVDYHVYAKLKDRKSDVKTLSQFDNRPQVVMNLRIDVP